VHLTTADYWQAQWSRLPSVPVFAFFDEVAKHLPRQEGATFFEVGYAPGGILAQFCSSLGYEAHGIDYAADPPGIRSFLEARGVRVGQLYKGDFLTWPPPRRYDVVASFGFVEHFDDPAAVVDRQFGLVRGEGHVVVTMPNYARGQWLLHRLFDPAMLEGHNLRCMSRAFLVQAAIRNQATLLFADYVGGHFAFWDSGNSRRGWVAERLLWRIVRALKLVAALLPRGTNPLFSPYLVAVYRARAEQPAERT